ncbi:MAG: BtpA/SgcQ family protein [Sulfolobales archaeon]
MYRAIAVIHLPRLPYIASRAEHGVEEIVERATSEAKILEGLGYNAIIVENFRDHPYRKRVLDPLAISSMSIVVREVVRSTSLEVGVNMLRNSGREAYSIAVASGARFIRVNSLIETIVSDSGIIEPEAPRLSTIRRNYPGVKVYADIAVKHAVSLNYVLSIIESEALIRRVGASEGLQDYLGELVRDYVERGGADALIVTGLRTGEPPSIDFLKIVKKNSSVPVLVGSGASPENIEKLARYSDGVIVGSYIREGGKAGKPLDLERARRFIEKIRSL